MNAVPIKHYFLLLILFCFGGYLSAQQSSISLSGKWTVKLDPDSVGEKQGFFNTPGKDPIMLPGTLDEAGYGKLTKGSDYGILTRKHKYIGPAWYSRDIIIPTTWKNVETLLYLERVMWESKVWVDGLPIGKQDGLGTPHYHNLGLLKPGKHRLTIRINNDMIYNIGDKGHAYGEYTQIIWNGMIGRIELQKVPALSINNVKVWPNAEENNLAVTFNLNNKLNKAKGEIVYSLRDLSNGKEVFSKKETLTSNQPITTQKELLQLFEPIKKWDDIQPNLYAIDITLKQGKQVEKRTITFGFRSITTSRSKILVNQRPVFMRGNLDCVHFPKTGYPSCEVSEWERIFRIYKSYGLNHVRFHSWCPPEAAFLAADRLGIYIQAEVLWIDWWMSIINPERPEMTTKGLPKGLGLNASADEFVPAEMRRIIDAYGNHPSFTMLCIGNELGNSNFEVMQNWVKPLKEEDNRRLYSVSTARNIMPIDQYMITHNIPNIGGTYGFMGNGTDLDRDSIYAKADIPIIAHELGQYPVYPLWKEIDKYTGTLEARNLKGLKELAEKNNIAHLDQQFHDASGALQTILYKELIENLARTSSCAGFNMLSMTDYSGQGEALIGWLDSFWDSKGIVTPEAFRGYSNHVVPLARFNKYVWSSNETFKAKIQVANYGNCELSEPLYWSLTTESGRLIQKGSLDAKLPNGKLNDAGEISIDLSQLTTPEKCILDVTIENTTYHNRWSIWVYPPIEKKASSILVKSRFDEEAIKALEKGEKVLLIADQLGKEETTCPINFMSLFWSDSFFPGQSNKTLGAWIDKVHPALAQFPTDNFADWQWRTISRGHSFIINKYPQLNPIVQPISDFHINNKLASIFECKVGKGKLMVCGYNLNKSTSVAEQLKFSLLNYMETASFDPNVEIETAELQQLFFYVPKATVAVPKGFENAALYVLCGKNMIEEGSAPWDAESDKIELQDKRCKYKVVSDNVWKDEIGTAWVGKEITVEIATPNGIIGDLYVKFEDWNNQNRSGSVSIEGRESVLEAKNGKSQWVKLFVMREDTNDGKVTFKARATNGGNLMISEIALIRN